MSLLLRLVKWVNWLDRSGEGWIGAGDIPADPLSDLRTEENGLSFWQIESNKSNLERVLAANAAVKDRPANMDFIVFEDKALKDAGIEYHRSPGETPDQEINSKYHYEANRISADKLVKMAKTIYDNWKPDRLDESEVKGAICNSYARGWFDLSKVNRKLRGGLAELCK